MSLETVEVKRGNKYLTIPKDAVDRYVAKGFDVVDQSGEVVIQSVPNDVVLLKRAYEEHTAIIKQLKAEIAELKKAPAKVVIKEAVKAEEPTTEKRTKRK